MYLLKFKKDALNVTDLNSKVVTLLKNIIEERQEGSYTYFSVKRIGNYLLGEGFFHETDEYYLETGFEVEVEYQFDFMEKPETESRFYAIWTDGKHSKYAPIDFFESYRKFGDNHRFESGCGDHLEVDQVLVSQEEVERLVHTLCREKSIDELLDKIAHVLAKQA